MGIGWVEIFERQKEKKITNSNVFKNVRKKIFFFFCGNFFSIFQFFFRKENYHKMHKPLTQTEHKTPSIKIEFSLFFLFLVVAKFNQYSPYTQPTNNKHSRSTEIFSKETKKIHSFFCKIQYEIIIKNVCLCCSTTTTTTKNSTKIKKKIPCSTAAVSGERERETNRTNKWKKNRRIIQVSFLMMEKEKKRRTNTDVLLYCVCMYTGL